MWLQKTVSSGFSESADTSESNDAALAHFIRTDKDATAFGPDVTCFFA